jgi:hypothetical protein
MVQRARIEERLDRLGLDYDHIDDGVRVLFTGDGWKTQQAIEEMSALGMSVRGVSFDSRYIEFRGQGQGLGLGGGW